MSDLQPQGPAWASARPKGGTGQLIPGVCCACLPSTRCRRALSRTRSLPRSDGATQRGDSHPRTCCDSLRTFLEGKCDFEGPEEQEAWARGGYAPQAAPQRVSAAAGLTLAEPRSRRHRVSKRAHWNKDPRGGFDTEACV